MRRPRLPPLDAAGFARLMEQARERYRRMDIAVPDRMAEQVVGIFVGGCVERGVGSSYRHQAHAHNERTDRYFGWICVRSGKRLGELTEEEQPDGRLGVTITKPSRLLWHEYAHILCPGHGHDDRWRQCMRALGQPLPRHYKKRRRGQKGVVDFPRR